MARRDVDAVARTQMLLVVTDAEHRPGDKIRVKVGSFRGARGVVVRVGSSSAVVDLAQGCRVSLPLESITNFSLAARRAWATMPKRAGRPRNSTRSKRMVSLRVDTEVWLGLAEAVRLGQIASREQAVNDWLRKHLNHLQRQNRGRWPDDTTEGQSHA